jgi:acyl-CoA dehydrogenase
MIAAIAMSEPGAKGVLLMLLETRDCEGYRVGRVLEKVGQKGQDTCELFFDMARVPLENVLGGVEG